MFDLRDCNLPGDGAARLRVAIDAAPAGTVEPDDFSTANTGAIAAATVAALDLRSFADVFPALLARVDRSTLSDRDAGRYWHLRALAAWKIDASTSTATRAFVKAELRLRSAGEAGKRYRARVHDTWGQMLHALGLLADARRALELALSLRDPKDEAGLAITLGNLGRLLTDLGDFTHAREYLERDLAIVERTTPARTRVRAQLLAHVARCSLACGDVEGARSRAEKAAGLAREANDPYGEGLAKIQIGLALLRTGDATRARAIAREVENGLEAVPRGLADELRAAMEHLVADIELAEGHAVEAARAYRAAHDRLSSAPSASPFERAELLVGLARALAATGARGDAASALRGALVQLDATAASARREEVERELKSHSLDAWLVHSAGRFIGQHHIERLFAEAGADGFRGQRRDIVALFSDIRGFTTLAEKLDPEQLILLLNDLLAQLTRCIERHGGAVDKFIGDAVMAVFPGDGPKSDAPLLAALAMQDELERFNLRLDHPVAMGVGIHAGSVVTGLIGSPQKREYTAIGDVINTASRLEGMTKQLGATILVSDAVVGRLADPERYLLRPLGTYAPKGRAAGLVLFDAMGERSDATPEVESEIDSMKAALADLSGRRFTAARDRFEALRAKAEKTGRAVGYAQLRDAAATFVEHPPSESWRGEIAMTSK